MRDPITEFQEYNRPFAQRNPELFRVKIARMAADPFAFFRGTFHLYSRDVLERLHEPIPLLSSGGIEMDLVGDIHSENYGTYQAADGKVYYGINDFDETVRGKPDFDVCRLAISIFLASRIRGDSLIDAVLITVTALKAYTDMLPRCLKKPKDFIINEATSCDCPAIDDLVRSGAAAKRTDFIRKETETGNGQRRLLRSAHFFNLPEAERQQAQRVLQDYVTRMPAPPTPDFYKVQDICGRVAGIGSMGRLRYAVLVNGKGNKEGRNVILEFKESRPSAYDLYRQRNTDAQALARRAKEVTDREREIQVASSPYLGYAVDGDMSFQVREIGPHDSRVDIKSLKTARIWEKVASLQGAILARAHARASAQAVGLVNPLVDVQDADAFCQRVLTFALGYADLVKQDWTRFVGQRTELEKSQG
jgi:uncharacterized protein (DUF2252 family)